MCVLLPVKVNSLEFCWNSLFALEPWRLDVTNERNWLQILFIYKQVYLQKRLWIFVNNVHTWNVCAEVELLEWNELNFGLASENRYVQTAWRPLGWIVSWFRQVILQNRPSENRAKISIDKFVSDQVFFEKITMNFVPGVCTVIIRKGQKLQ